MKIYKKWGANAVDLTKENPYRLCEHIYGIGFERADTVSDPYRLYFYERIVQRVFRLIRGFLNIISAFSDGQKIAVQDEESSQGKPFLSERDESPEEKRRRIPPRQALR